MSPTDPPGAGRRREHVRPDERLLSGGVKGVALVSLATVGLVGLAALVALLVSIAF